MYTQRLSGGMAVRNHVTPRERQVLALTWNEGLCVKEIAHKLKISPNTVKGLIRMVKARTGIVNLTQLCRSVFQDESIRVKYPNESKFYDQFLGFLPEK